VYDLNLVVPVSPSPLKVTGTLYLGALIGSSTNPDLLVKNVHVTGGFNIDQMAGAVNIYVAGIIGNVAGGADFQMEQCSVDMNITFAESTNTPKTMAIGGMVGNISATVVAYDCYTAGSITGASNCTSAQTMYIGGMFARNYSGGNVTVSRCYSSMTLDINRLTSGSSYPLVVGGLIGHLNTSVNTLTSLVALNPSLTGTYPGTEVNIGRILGRASAPHITGAYALDSMTLDFNGPRVPTSSSTGIQGESTAAATLNTASFWTSTLGWSSDIWDFSGVANGGYPTLK
jgi:hypothetical protein